MGVGGLYVMYVVVSVYHIFSSVWYGVNGLHPSCTYLTFSRDIPRLHLAEE